MRCGVHMVLAIMLVTSQAAVAAHAMPTPTEITIDGTAPGRVFDGVGATSASVSRLLIDYPPEQRDEILDYLFKPNYGAALQMLKVEVGSDANSTEAAEPSHARNAGDLQFDRGYEWWLAKEARKRNPAIKLIALAWNFPSWVGAANSQATADYLISFLEGARQHHGLDFDYVGIWNETRMDLAFIKTLHATLTAHGLKTRIMADDSVNSWGIVQAMDADASLRAAVSVIATHYPRWLSTPEARSKSAAWSVPLWSSEDGPWGDEWGIAGQQSPSLASLLNRNYILGRMTSTNVWALISSYYDIFDLPNAGLLRAKTPWSGHYEITSPLWVVAHTTQFAQPGWRYIDSASAVIDGVGSYVGLHDGANYSVIVETLGATAAHDFKLVVRGGLSTGPVYVWRSNTKHWFERVARLVPRAGVFNFSFEPDSVYTLTTTTGQHKGRAMAVPPDQPFPTPYHDDFESPGGSLAPRYLFEANGAFEIAACDAGRHGQCLQQLAEQSPIAWTYFGDWPKSGTLATLGDVRWRDYRVAADVLVPGKGYVALFGRVSRVSPDGVVDAYQTRLYDDGRWELRAAANGEPLRQGKLAAPMNGWRHVELELRGERIAARVDSIEVVAISDSAHAAGLAGLGAGWNRASFDNLEVTPIAPGLPIIATVPRLARASTAPMAPELFVPEASDHRVRLRWRAVDGAIGYRVRIGTQEGVFDKGETVGPIVDYTFRTLTNGVKYFFNVAAVGAVGEGKPSGTQYAVPGPSGSEP